jgi:hypothetical protein
METANIKLSIAIAEIHPADMVGDIERAIERLNRVNSPTSKMLAGHFETLLIRATYRHAEIKRIAIAIGLISLGDL